MIFCVLQLFKQVTDAKRQSFDRNVRKPYLQALVDCLRQRFPGLPVISALGIFDTRNLPHRTEVAEYGLPQLNILLDELDADDIPSDSAAHLVVDPTQCRLEWTALKSAMLTHPNLRASKGVPQMFELLAEQHAGDYPNLARIADWGLAICLSTAECERDFSLLKLVKTAM
eukprot:scpid58850/ scgid6285/ 